MPRGARPGERRGGRDAGVPNKATTEAIERERIEQQLAAPATAATVAAATAAAPEMTTAIVEHRKLAKERLEDLLELFIGATAYYRPSELGGEAGKKTWPEFKEWATLAMNCAKEAAKYQSPQFRAIVVAPAPNPNQPDRRRRFTLTIFESGPPKLLEAPPAPPTSDQQH